jgi:hypothetical protein
MFSEASCEEERGDARQKMALTHQDYNITLLISFVVRDTLKFITHPAFVTSWICG